MPSITLKWVTMGDDRVCPICQALNGYEWKISGNDYMPTQLLHPTYGLVWDIYQGSEAHGHKAGTCRCKPEPSQIDVQDIEEVVQSLNQVVNVEYGQ